MSSSKTPSSPVNEAQKALRAEEKKMEQEHFDRFGNLDSIANGDHKGERMGQVKSAYLAPPTNQAWYDKQVGVPQRMALFTMFCMISYIVVVFASMGVSSLRWMMVNWLMYVLLGLNFAMMIILAVFVYIRKKDYGVTAITDLATGRGTEKQEFTV